MNIIMTIKIINFSRELQLKFSTAQVNSHFKQNSSFSLVFLQHVTNCIYFCSNIKLYTSIQCRNKRCKNISISRVIRVNYVFTNTNTYWYTLNVDDNVIQSIQYILIILKTTCIVRLTFSLYLI